jgi:hypothetical protein
MDCPPPARLQWELGLMLEPFRPPSSAVSLGRRRGIKRPTRQAGPDAAPVDGAPPAGPQFCLLFLDPPQSEPIIIRTASKP